MTVVTRLRLWNRSLDDPIDVRALAVLRIATGPLVLIHLRRFLTDAAQGTIYSDHFNVPFWSWYPQLPRDVYVGLLWVVAAASVLVSIGLFTRLAAWVTVAGVTYNVFLSQTHFHHNRAFLIILLTGVAVIPVGRTISVDAWRARRRGSPLPPTGGTVLARTVLRVEIATVYAASGLSKLLDADWWGGTVTRLRIEQHRPRLAETPLPDRVVDLLADPGFQAVAAKVIVMTELFIGLGLLVRRTRRAAIWVAIPFHVAIQLTAAVQVFSLAALAALVVWVDRPSGHRVAHAGPGWAVAIRGLDWTGRFTIEPSDEGLWVDEGSGPRRGAAAKWSVLSLLPPTFWIAAPIRALRRA